MYDPKDNGCQRGGLRVRRRQHPCWINDGTKLDYSITFTSLNFEDVSLEDKFLKELKESRIKPI